jgi:prophage antirepressor-like protein
LQIFNNERFGEIRVAMINGEPYFVGVDVARALEYAKPTEAVRNHCKGDPITYGVTDGLGRIQETRVVPLGDVCRLIIKAATQSKNAEIQAKAEKYERWIFDEVLPEIHRTGGYGGGIADVSALTAATGFIREVRRAMEKQGNTAYEIARMIESVCRFYALPLPPNFAKDSKFDQLTYIVSVQRSAEASRAAY